MRMYVIDMLGSKLTGAGILLDVTRSIGTFFVVLTEAVGVGEGGVVRAQEESLRDISVLNVV